MPELEKVSEIILLYGRVQITVYKKQLFDPKKQLFSTMATLIAPSNQSPVEDAESLRKAFKGHIIQIFFFFFLSFFLTCSLFSLFALFFLPLFFCLLFLFFVFYYYYFWTMFLNEELYTVPEFQTSLIVMI